MRKGQRSGFTMVEVFFACLITAVLLGVFWNIFYTQHSTAYRLTRKNEALTSALVTAEVLGKDLRQLVTVPVVRKPDGSIARFYGDHTAPAKISDNGKSIAFYIPRRPEGRNALEPGKTRSECVTVIYARVPARKPGTYYVRRAVVDDPDKLQAIADGSAQLPGKNLAGVLVADLSFRLLDPKAKAAIYRSPDSNYYLEAVIEGTDATGKETQTLPLLVNLEYPSTRQMTPNIQEVVAYTPLAPLVTPPDTFNPSPEEQQTISQISTLTQQLTDGSIDAPEYAQQITDLINRHAGGPNDPVIQSTGNIVPHIDQLTIVQTPNPGEPVIMQSPTGTTVVVAPPPTAPAPGTPASPPITTITPPGHRWWLQAGSMHFQNGQLVHANHFRGGGDGNMTQGQIQNILNQWMNDQYNMYGEMIQNQRNTQDIAGSYNEAMNTLENTYPNSSGSSSSG